MKIKEMVAKTSLEIQSTDVFIIEDLEDTKQVTAKELIEYLFAGDIAKEIITVAINGILDSEYVGYSEEPTLTEEPIEQDK